MFSSHEKNLPMSRDACKGCISRMEVESRPSLAVASEDNLYDIGTPTVATEKTDSVFAKLLAWRERLRARRAQYNEAKETLEAKKASLMAMVLA